ncbi:DEAD/DEAH box helicase [Rhizobium leguminosarum]|uniref:DEAD/DEAH box helicase n=1 Tax=Rhizobium leguminosarum TaxID=384 RepID=UPI001C95B96A|nr:DEAD/DEAH box helicase [Rhizobium leguminosarum]MBY5639520.1 DEAD/DEAH box helicase [Rhizobium leguminosarum]
MARGLNVEPASWGYLLAVAQREIGFYQKRLLLPDNETLLSEEVASPLIAAARIVLEVAGSFERTASDVLDVQKARERALLLTLAGCAFGMYGNFPSAAAVHKKLDHRELRSDGLWLAAAISNPRLIPRALLSSHITDQTRAFIERLNYFLRTGDEGEGDKLVRHLEELMVENRPPAEMTLLGCARLALKQITTLATATLLRRDSNSVFHRYVWNIIEDQRYCLLPPQYNILKDGDLLESENNCIITLPTSTGKTLIAELIIAARMSSAPRVAIYVVPYIALGRQVYDTLRKHAPDNVTVHGYFGVFNSHTTIPSDTYSVLVVTPERLDGILRTSSNIYQRLDTIVFDEAHGVENGSRGARLEAIITRFRLQQQKSYPLRIVLLSAVLSDVVHLRRWLGTDAEHYSDTWRPTARRLAIWTHEGVLAWIYGTDPLRPHGKQSVDPIGSKHVPRPHFVKPAEAHGLVNAQRPANFSNAAYLARYLHDTLGGPILLACGSKASTRGLATAIAAAHPTSKDQPSSDLAEFIRRRHPHLKPLSDMADKGVAYHNASLPPEVREAVEDAVKSRKLAYVTSTTTLAEGVDLPFRCTIVFDWLTGFGETQAPMPALLFRNIAGRCGRAGEFTEGDTIIFDNQLGRLEFTSEQTRRRSQTKLFADPPPVASVFANDNTKVMDKRAVMAVAASQLLASIPENAEVDELQHVFAGQSYAAALGNAPNELFAKAREELLSDAHGEPFARAASPMRLTGLGEAANRTGFGPLTCRALIDYVKFFESQDDFSILAYDLVLAFGAMDEQENQLLRDIASLKKNRFFMKANDIPPVAACWLRGAALTEAFLALPKAKESKSAVRPDEWVKGAADSESVASQYDKFVDVTQYTFGVYLPWLLRALSTFSMYGSQDALSFPWQAAADAFETSRTLDAAGALDFASEHD